MNFSVFCALLCLIYTIKLATGTLVAKRYPNRRISYNEKNSFAKFERSIRTMGKQNFGGEAFDTGKMHLVKTEKVVGIGANGVLGMFEHNFEGLNRKFFVAVEIGTINQAWELREVGNLCTSETELEATISKFLDDNLRFHPKWTVCLNFLNSIEKKFFLESESEAFDLIKFRIGLDFNKKEFKVRPNSLNVNLMVSCYTLAQKLSTGKNSYYTITLRRNGEPMKLKYVSPMFLEENLMGAVAYHWENRLMIDYLEEWTPFEEITNSSTVAALSVLTTEVCVKLGVNVQLNQIRSLAVGGKIQRLANFTLPAEPSPKQILVMFNTVDGKLDIQHISKPISQYLFDDLSTNFLRFPYDYIGLDFEALQQNSSITDILEKYKNLTHNVQENLIFSYGAKDITIQKIQSLPNGQDYVIYEFQYVNLGKHLAGIVGVVAGKVLANPSPGRGLRGQTSTTTSEHVLDLALPAWKILFISSKIKIGGGVNAQLGHALQRYFQNPCMQSPVGEWIHLDDISDKTFEWLQVVLNRLATTFLHISVDKLQIIKMKSISSNGNNILLSCEAISDGPFLAVISKPIAENLKQDSWIHYVSSFRRSQNAVDSEANAYLDSPMNLIDILEDKVDCSITPARSDENLKHDVLSLLGGRSTVTDVDLIRKVKFPGHDSEEIYIYKEVGYAEHVGTHFVFAVVDKPNSLFSYLSPLMPLEALDSELRFYHISRPSYLEDWTAPQHLSVNVLQLMKEADPEVIKREEKKNPPAADDKIPNHILLQGVRSESTDAKKKRALYWKTKDDKMGKVFYVDLELVNGALKMIGMSDLVDVVEKIDVILDDLKVKEITTMLH